MSTMNLASPDPSFELLDRKPDNGFPLVQAPLLADARWPHLRGTLVLIRHAETAENANNLIVGHIDPILPPERAPEVKAMASRLRETRWLRVITSDLQRSRMTAEIFAAVTGAPLVISPLLREAHFGELDGLSKDSARYRRETVQRRIDKYAFRPAGGESYADMEGRIVEFLSGLHAPVDEALLVVTHIGPLRVLYKLVCGAAPAAAADLDLGHLSASILNFRTGTSVWGARL